MATTRFGHLDDFTLKNSKVGIGTSTPTEALEVLGGARGASVDVTGIATLTSYEGFQNKKTSYTENVTIDSGVSGTLSGEVVIGAGLTMSVGTGATSGQGNIKSLKVSNTFTPPIGGTNDRPSAPQQGALYYNKDFKTIEYWDGNFWRQVDNTTRMGRGFILGGVAGGSPSYISNIQSFQIATLGNTTHFGNLVSGKTSPAGASDGIRGIAGGGTDPSGAKNEIDYYTMASGGTAVDFGNLTQARYSAGAVSSSTRGCFAGGWVPNNSNVIDYVEIKTLGDAVDFGDLSEGGNHGNPGMQSPTRGIFCGGYGSFSPDVNSPYAYNRMQLITIASKGNTTRFGELNVGGARGGAGGNSVRGVWGGGVNLPSSAMNALIEYVIIASEGNGTNFGELTVARRNSPEVNDSSTRAVFCGGIAADGTAPAATNYMDYITISSEGNAVDFGDVTGKIKGQGAISDSHGGLGGF